MYKMNHKLKCYSSSDPLPCEKFVNKLLRQEALSASSKKSTPRPFQDKFSVISKSPVQPQRPKPRTTAKQQSTIQKVTANVVNNIPKEHFESISGGAVKEVTKTSKRDRDQAKSSPTRARSNSRSSEAWGQLLKSNRSKEKVSNFGNFDPLRTLHFLSKELFTKLQGIIPEQDEVLQMVTDIQHALKRIPPEVTTLLHNPQVEYAQSDFSGCTHKSTSTKTCQTPPTLYQEDTERFKQIMAENTYRLEVSCKQLEEVCANLQSEKERAEKELEHAKESAEVLCRRVKELEEEVEYLSEIQMKKLEQEKRDLQEQLRKALEELDANPKLIHLNKLVDDLTKQKKRSDEACSMLQYDMTILKMEKEKVVTMLAVRDKEIEQIQSEMARIQDQVNQQLKKLNTDTLQQANSAKTLSDQFNGMPEDLFLDIGDTTTSSIFTNTREKQPHNVNESPCGDTTPTAMMTSSKENMLKNLKGKNNVDPNLPTANKQKEEESFENLIRGMSPSMQAFLKSQNL